MDGERSRFGADTLIEVALAIAAEEPLGTVLHRLLDLAVELTRAGRGAIVSIDPEGAVRDIVVSGTPPGRRPQLGASSTTAEVVRALLRDARPTRLQGLAVPSSSMGFPAGQAPVSSLVGGPIRVLDRCYGFIYLADKRGDRCFTDEDERLVGAMAAQAAMAYHNLRLASEARLHAAWHGALTRAASAARTGGPIGRFLGEVAGAARALADADLALVIGPGGGQGHPTILAADGDGAARLLGLPAPRPAPLRPVTDASPQPPVSPLLEMGPAIAVPAPAGVAAGHTLWVMRAERRPEFDPAVSVLVESFWEHVAIMRDHVVLHSSQAPAVGADQGRLARQLHDDVVQTLFGIGMEIQAAALRLGDGELAARLQGAAENLDWLIERLRHHDQGAAGLTGGGTAASG